MTKPDVVTVIIAAYNAQSTLLYALNSVFTQRQCDIEVIVVDDCSQDNTLALAKQYANGRHNMHVLQTPANKGPSAARNLALDIAKGNWVTVLDADDAFLPNRLITLLTNAKQHNLDMIADSYFISPSQTHTTGATRLTSLFTKHTVTQLGAADFIRNGLGSVKPLIRRSVIERLHGRFNEDCRSGEDLLLYTSLIMQGGQFGFLNKPLYNRTERPDSLSRENKVAFLKGILSVLDTLTQQVSLNDEGLIKAIDYRKGVIRDALDAARWRHWLSSTREKRVPSLASLTGVFRHLIFRKKRYSMSQT